MSDQLEMTEGIHLSRMDERRRKLEKLRDKYQQRAEKAFEEYQDSGVPGKLRTYERNEEMVDALTIAINAGEDSAMLHLLREYVMAIPTDDVDKMREDVKWMQARVRDGMV